MSLKLELEPEQLRKKFFELKTREDIANLLEISTKDLNYYIHRLPPEKRYTVFEIPKKSGGTRKISAPISSLKIIQSKLKQVLEAVYVPQAPAHGFVVERSIITNVEAHVKRKPKYVFNVDIKDFFPSIHLGRVRGMFKARPYNLPVPVSTILAQICCFDTGLPQGAPTSPIIANMICAKMDGQLLKLAKSHRCTYTRYVDDITFSTSMPKFPKALAVMKTQLTGQQLEVGEELKEIFDSNRFIINTSKIRLQTANMRQEITGITVNEFPNVQRRYISQIRAMLHAWNKFGFDKAEEEFRSKYAKKHRSEYNQVNNPISFKAVVGSKIGYLGMVRGKDDFLYSRFYYQFKRLCGGLPLTDPVVFVSHSSTNLDFASKLVDSLAAKGINAWLDAKDILPSMDWDDTIDIGLRTCRGIIVIITPESMASDNVKHEWNYFLQEKKPIIPLLLEATPEKDIHYRLRAIQFSNFCGTDYNTEFEKLLKTLKRRKVIS